MTIHNAQSELFAETIVQPRIRERCPDAILIDCGIDELSDTMIVVIEYRHRQYLWALHP